jgi:hypothetical protein
MTCCEWQETEGRAGSPVQHAVDPPNDGYAATSVCRARAPPGWHAKDHNNQPERGHHLGEPLPRSSANLRRQLKDIDAEHGVCQPGTEHHTDELRRDVQ